MNYIKRHYDPSAGDGAAAIPMPPSLADLSNPNYTPPLVKLDDAAAAQKLTDDAAATEATKKAAGDNPPPADPVDGRNEDGTLAEGYIEDADGKAIKDPTFKPTDNTTDTVDDSPEAFFADVDKLHGNPIKVEYPDGVDPLTPEGIYHRDKVVAEQAVQSFEAYLKKADPRSYAYMLHRQAGGDDESFYSFKTFSLPEYSTFKDNVDLQVTLYKSSLISKGLDADTAQMAVDKAIKDGVLFDKADAAYKTTEASHEHELKLIEEQQQKAEQAYTASVNALSQKLSTTINEGAGMRIIIPDTDKVAFNAYVREHLEYDGKDGKFLLVQRVGDNLTQQLESLYLLFKKGDLSGLIKTQAQTAQVKRLKRAVEKTKDDNKSGADDTAGKNKGFVSLGSL
jgi:hypothetical protein